MERKDIVHVKPFGLEAQGMDGELKKIVHVHSSTGFA
jgi:hypothetical protein